MAQKEYNKVSSKGYRGQSIVFTNSRKNCYKIADSLNIKAAPYHAGLSYIERKKVENAFLKGKIAVVVTTAALGAGVDFPASQVIFESLAMGIQGLSVQEFHQMLGRAGRPDYHDLGKVVILADPDSTYGKESEDEIAFKLLNQEIEHIGVQYEEEAQIEQALANLAVVKEFKEIDNINKFLLCKGDFNYLYNKLKEFGFINKANKLTEFGKVVTTHFLNREQAFLIKESVLKEKNPIDIVTNLEVFEAVYFKNIERITRYLNLNIPYKVFHGASLDLVFSGESISKLDSKLQKQILNFAKEFFICKCKDTPYCGCPQKNFAKKIISLRMQGLDTKEIIQELSDLYGVYAYNGDLLDYLDQVVRYLDAIENIAKVFGKKEIAKRAKEFIKGIEG
ncbi:MAG: DUF5814 domain-containing protein [Methanosarcinales archaeon]